MSSFSVPIKRIRSIDPHPNADLLEIAAVDGYSSIVKRGEYQAGDLAAYLPEGSVLPDWLLQHMGFWKDGKGTLAGSEGNTVKAIKLRGVLSQGILFPAKNNFINVNGANFPVVEGQDVSELLGVTKYEPPIPVAMSGEVFSVDTNLTLSFDVENFKSYPDVFQDGEEVVFTEKIHGTCTVVALLPTKHAHPEAFGVNNNILIFSKGLGSKGLVFKNNEVNQNNLYVRSTRSVVDSLNLMRADTPLFVLGETYGKGVQDLDYDTALDFNVFAVVEGYRGSQRFLDWDEVYAFAQLLCVDTVPVLYRGPFSKEVMLEHTRGKTTLGEKHVREGIVIVPAVERTHPSLGRVCLKSVSEDYLLRKGGTEFN